MERRSGTRITVDSGGAGMYRVTVDEGGDRTVHRVTVGPDDLSRFAPPGTAPERLLTATFEFLLEREPKEAILPRFPLSLVERYFPEYPTAVRKRL